MMPELPAAVPEIPVSDVAAATQYYREKLSFAIDWIEADIALAGISRDRCRIFLAGPASRGRRPSGRPRARVASFRSMEPSDDADERVPLVAYAFDEPKQLRIVPAATQRQWMIDTRDGFANRCLPLTMANQAGWWVLNRDAFRATWNGADGSDAITIQPLGTEPPFMVVTHFGHGVLSWQVNFVFRTPPGWNLLVRGPANLPKDGISALEGVVETDWSVAVFSMNWKFTRPGVTVTFDRDEPFCMLLPQRRGELERVEPMVQPLAANVELHGHVKEWKLWRQHTRVAEMWARQRGAQEGRTIPIGFERDYIKGRSPTGLRAEEHQTRLRLRKVAYGDGALDPGAGGSADDSADDGAPPAPTGE